MKRNSVDLCTFKPCFLSRIRQTISKLADVCDKYVLMTPLKGSKMDFRLRSRSMLDCSCISVTYAEASAADGDLANERHTAALDMCTPLKNESEPKNQQSKTNTIPLEQWRAQLNEHVWPSSFRTSQQLLLAKVQNQYGACKSAGVASWSTDCSFDVRRVFDLTLYLPFI